jgi:NAD(P)-dependent dehydrogenase (short-subunit alcohol dehydrogenase family)
MRFHDKIVVVIGGNSGIGLASAFAFAREGAQVVISGRNTETLAKAAAQIGPTTLALQADIADLAAMERFFQAVRERHGRIDVLFVNAGIGRVLPLEQVTEAQWDQILSINLKGPYFAVQKAVPMMRAGGAIVLTSSIGHAKGIPGNSVYAASKAGVRALARNLGAELVGRGIRVNCFSPGPIDTPLIYRSGVPEAEVAALRQFITAQVPMKRFGSPEEAARPVLFLASDEASFITGVDLFADGGMVSF